MLTQFRSYQLAVKCYRDCRSIKIPTHLKSQLERAASGIALCLAEGYSRKSFQDKNRFYQMSLDSVRECQSIFHLVFINSHGAALDFCCPSSLRFGLQHLETTARNGDELTNTPNPLAGAILKISEEFQ